LNIFYKVYHTLDYIFDPNFKVIIKSKGELREVLNNARDGGELIDIKAEIKKLESAENFKAPK